MDIKELENNIRKSDPDYDKKVKALNKVLKEYFGKIIYLTPDVYKCMLGLNLAITDKDIKSGKYRKDELITVYSRLPVNNKVKQDSFLTTKSNGVTIRRIIKNSTQFMFPEINGIKFNGEQLIINSIPITIKRDSARYFLCEFMFGNEISMPWDVEDLATALGNQIDKKKDWYHYVYSKIRWLNEAIKKETQYSNFIISQNALFVINPTYQFLLSK